MLNTNNDTNINIVSYVEELKEMIDEINETKSKINTYQNELQDTYDIDENSDEREDEICRVERDLSQEESLLEYLIENLKDKIISNNIKMFERLISYTEKTFSNVIL